MLKTTRERTMKKTQQTKTYRITHTPAQKFWGLVAFLCFFACGIMIGIGINQKTIKTEPTLLSGCQIIEQELLSHINNDVAHYIYDNPTYNIEIYEKLLSNGCPENTEKYNALLEREKQVVSALSPEHTHITNTETCTQIEESLLVRLPDGDKYTNSEDRIMRAKIYANLSERGCPENQQKYYDLAKQELDIARALEDDEFNEPETIEVVETYKRLNMQAAAEEIFETTKKLVNPAIDFILEVEQIINEK